MNIKDIMDQAHETAKAVGWWDDEKKNFGELMALIHSEVTEAFEDHRAGRHVDGGYYEGKKPCGIPIELADIIIRVCDLCEEYGVDLEDAIAVKLAYNKTRPHKHGGKTC